MRHRLSGRHLGRETSHRLALYRNLFTDLLRYERITTTEAKAKEIRPIAERIITLARRGDVHARRLAQRFVYDERVVKRAFAEIGPRMKDRPGGYLRITSIEPRKGDGARMASIEFVDYVEAPPTPRPQRVTAAPATGSAAAPVPLTPPPALEDAPGGEAGAEAPAGDALDESIRAEAAGDRDEAEAAAEESAAEAHAEDAGEAEAARRREDPSAGTV
ncbi:MAG: 50S ribosomal protein L17 [Tepidiformaceae bacterium]